MTPNTAAGQKRIRDEYQQKQAAIKKASKVIMGNIVQVVPEGLLGGDVLFHGN